jgi:hypothetical protein
MGAIVMATSPLRYLFFAPAVPICTKRCSHIIFLYTLVYRFNRDDVEVRLRPKGSPDY